MLRDRLERFFARRFVENYDSCMRPLERRLFGAARRRLLPTATGRILEIGAGSGVNFAYYEDRADAVVAFDPDPGMLDSARPKRERARVPVHLVQATAERLPFSDGSFDTIVATLVFCTIPSMDRAFAEAARVLAAGGRLLMIEHVRSSFWPLGVLQDLLTPIQKIVAAGCHLNRRTQDLVSRHGFRIDRMTRRLLGTIVEVEAVKT